ncbi:MAG TPA: DUF6152 family protein [Paracoccaceae bacterium]|nr:DUF6152 family protein [Paracoccaceae bacterium]
MRITALAITAALAAVPAAAHHGWGSYDSEAAMTIEGPIETVTIGNPHGEMTVEHEGQSWLVILAPPSRMQARGASEDLLQPGVTVRTYGYPRRDGTPEIRAEWIEVGDERIPLR